MSNTFKISCEHCSHTVQVDPRAVGKEIQCQRCGKRFLVHPPAPELITVACTCGKRYKVPASQAGKRAKCNACGTPLVIPPARPIVTPPEMGESDYESVDIEHAKEPFRPSPRQITIGAGAFGLVMAIILTAVWFTSGTSPSPRIVQTPPAAPPAERPRTVVTPASRPAVVAIQQPTKSRGLTPATKPSTPSVVTIIPTPSPATMPTQMHVETSVDDPISLGELDEQGRPIGKPRELNLFVDGKTHVSAVAISPDGKLLAVCGHSLIIREVPSGKAIQELKKGHSYPNNVIFLADSSRVLWTSSTDRVAWLTDVQSGLDLQQFPVENNYLSAMAISPDSKLVATASGYEIRIRELETGKPYITLSTSPPSVTHALAFLPDGRHLLTGGNNGAIYLWDYTNGKQIRGFLGHTGHIKALALLPDAKSFFSSAGGFVKKNGKSVPDNDTAIRQWNIGSAHEIRRLTGHKNWVEGLSLSSNGQYLLSCSGSFDRAVPSEDNTIRFWKVSTGQEFFAFRGHTDVILSAAISPNGRYAISGSMDRTARLWLLPEEVWEDRPADAVVISERRNMPAISRKISGEAAALIEAKKWDEAIALLKEVETDLSELAEQNNLPLWDTTISPIFRLIESKRAFIQTKREQSDDSAATRPAATRPGVRLTAEQNRELANIRIALGQVETMIREKKLVQAQSAVYKAQDELKLYAQTNQVPEWIAPVALLFQTAAKRQDEIEEARNTTEPKDQVVAQVKPPANASVQQPQTAEGLQPGQPAPGFTALTLDGGQFSTQQFKGKYVLLDFWATWCGPCKAEMPYLADVYQTYGKDKRFVLISLSMDSQIQTPAQYAMQNGMNWVQGFLGSNSPVTKLYHVSGIPAIILIGPDGKILATRLRGNNIKKKVGEVLAAKTTAKTTPKTTPKTTVLHVDLSLEDGASAPIKITSQDKRIVRETNPGRIDLDVSSLPKGNHHLFFGSPGYASQWTYIALPDAVVSDAPRQIELFRERYVVMRYAFNKTSGRSLVGDDVEKGRAAVAHWGSLEFFGGDWQVWQSDNSGAGFGKIPYLQFHRFTSGFGFLEPPRGRSFDELKEAAEFGYQCRNVKAVKGTVLMCRVNGNKPEGQGYGKIMIEDVTETPPRGVTVIQSRAH